MDQKRIYVIVAAVAIFLGAAVIVGSTFKGCSCTREKEEEIIEVPIVETLSLFGIEYNEGDFVIEEGTIQSGQTISSIFAEYGISPAMVDRTAKKADSVFSLRNIRAGHKYTCFLTPDSLNTLSYFVYEHSVTDYLVISFEQDDVNVYKESKEVTLVRRKHSGRISSSLWNSMVEAEMPVVMSLELEKIYQWTIDFFGLREGDEFTVVYDEKIVDDQSIGVGRVWGAIFTHAGKPYYAIPFKQDDVVSYWDELANSLRKSMLKAPLQYSRISSRFSNARRHPITKRVRPHHGVDYAAPAGTPVHSVADGTITFRGWDRGGGGNTLKIRHASGLVTGYLHLQGFAKGIVVGARVGQGDLIGYVGSTGMSTGPHLDYRIWKNGTAIDPLKITAEPVEPITKQNMADFEMVKERIIAELKGDIPNNFKITQLDSLNVYRRQSEPAPTAVEGDIASKD